MKEVRENPWELLPTNLKMKELDAIIERVDTLSNYGNILISQSLELFRKGNDAVAIGVRNSGSFLLKEYQTLCEIMNKIKEYEEHG